MGDIFDTMIDVSARGPVPLEYVVPGTLKMVDKEYPHSLSETEFEFMREFIVRHDLKRGYEVATGFGVSAVAAGLGFKETGGQLVTMDSYVEEEHGPGREVARKLRRDADGLTSTRFLIDAYGLTHVVYSRVGWSPEDTLRTICSVFDMPNETVDFVFIDGEHSHGVFMADLMSVVSIMNHKRCVLFFHDTERLERGMEFVEDLFAQTSMGVPDHQHGHNMRFVSMGGLK